MTKIKSVDEAVGEMTKHTMWRDNEMKLLENRLNEIITQDRLSHKEAIVEALEGMKRIVQTEEPFVPHYKPDGMSEEEYAYHIHNHEQERAVWQADCEHNQALDQAIAIVNSIYKDSE